MIFNRRDYLIMALAILLFIFAAYRATSFYYSNGIHWDFISNYLNAVSVNNPQFLSHLTLYSLDDVDNNGIYFEINRAPLPYLILAIFMKLSFAYATPIFIIFCLALLLLVSFYMSDHIRQNRLILLSLLLVPYTAFTLIFDDPEDILSLALILIFLVLLLKKSKYSGIFLGLAGLAKYTSLSLYL